MGQQQEGERGCTRSMVGMACLRLRSMVFANQWLRHRDMFVKNIRYNMIGLCVVQLVLRFSLRLTNYVG